MRACRAGGRAVLVGMGSEVHALDMTHAQIHEIDIVASFRYVNTVRATRSRTGGGELGFGH